MKVPIYDDAQVAPTTGVNSPAPRLVQANTEVAQALDNAGSAVGGAVDRIGEAAAKAAAQAQAQKEAEALAAYQKAVNQRLDGDSSSTGAIDAAFDGRQTTGFLSTRGDQAHAAAGDVLKGVEEDRQRIRDTLPAAAQKAFEQRSQAMLLEARHRVESHSAQQFEVAKQAAAKGLEDTTVAAAASDYNNPFAWVKTAEVEKSIRALQLSPEDGDAKVSAYKQKIAMAQIGGALAAQDIGFAETRYEASKEALGIQAVHVRAQIDEKKRALEARGMKAEAEDVVAEIVQKSLDPDGYLDRSKATELLRSVPADKRTTVRGLLDDQVRLEVGRKEEDIKRWRNQAQGMFNAGGSIRAIEPETMKKIHKFDSDFERRLMEEQRMRDDRWRKLHSDSKSERAAAAREQARLNLLAKQAFLALPAEERATTNLEEFTIGTGVDDVGRGDLGVWQRKAKDQVTNKTAAAADAFVREAESAVKPLMIDPKKKALKKGLEPEVPANFAANAVQAFHDFEVKEKRPPNEAERREMIGQLQRDVVVEEHWYGDKKRPAGFLPPSKTPSPPVPAPVAAAQPTSPATNEMVKVRLKSTGKTGSIPKKNFNPDKYDLVNQ